MKLILEKVVGKGEVYTTTVEPGYTVTIANNSAGAKKFRMVQVRGRGRPAKEKNYESPEGEVGQAGAGVPTADGNGRTTGSV